MEYREYANHNGDTCGFNGNIIGYIGMLLDSSLGIDLREI